MPHIRILFVCAKVAFQDVLYKPLSYSQGNRFKRVYSIHVEPLDEEEDEGGKEEPVQLEDWVGFVRRATGIAEEQLTKTKLEDWVAGRRRRKWRWAGHAARRKDHR